MHVSLKSINNLSLVKTMNKLSVIKSINNLTHMKSINNLSQLKCKQNFHNKNLKNSHRCGRRGVIVPTLLGWLSCGRFISWRAFVYLFEEWIQGWLLYPGFLDPRKMGNQGVIKMIKAHFHGGNIRLIIFHKFGQFIPAREHLFKVLRWNSGTVLLVLVLLVPLSFPLLHCPCLFIVKFYWLLKWQLLPVVLHQLLHVFLIDLQAHGTTQTHNFLNNRLFLQLLKAFEVPRSSRRV